MSTPVTSTPYANRGVDVSGFDTFPTGVKAPAFLMGPSGSEVAMGVRGPGISVGATLTLTTALHQGRLLNLDTAAGSVATLPAATGTGDRYRFNVTVLATSNSHIVKVANSTDTLQGTMFSQDDTSANAVAFSAIAGTDDTITLNRTTTGSVTIGEYFEIEDIAAGKFLVRGNITNTGTPATPFSATV